MSTMGAARGGPGVLGPQSELKIKKIKLARNRKIGVQYADSTNFSCISIETLGPPIINHGYSDVNHIKWNFNCHSF